MWQKNSDRQKHHSRPQSDWASDRRSTLWATATLNQPYWIGGKKYLLGPSSSFLGSGTWIMRGSQLVATRGAGGSGKLRDLSPSEHGTSDSLAFFGEEATARCTWAAAEKTARLSSATILSQQARYRADPSVALSREQCLSRRKGSSSRTRRSTPRAPTRCDHANLQVDRHGKR